MSKDMIAADLPIKCSNIKFINMDYWLRAEFTFTNISNEKLYIYKDRFVMRKLGVNTVKPNSGGGGISESISDPLYVNATCELYPGDTMSFSGDYHIDNPGNATGYTLNYDYYGTLYPITTIVSGEKRSSRPIATNKSSFKFYQAEGFYGTGSRDIEYAIILVVKVSNQSKNNKTMDLKQFFFKTQRGYCYPVYTGVYNSSAKLIQKESAIFNPGETKTLGIMIEVDQNKREDSLHFKDSNGKYYQIPYVITK
jgi:hypothetical protein